ncbi:CPXCG motif-containing cysteine-rich protein [Arhodomonas sp. AD133]|uniref:CPXCG motif-containing cysteine-rich protein n=1 Tax=Arhodomonas sp. AD133 TaxID=3415009 RepID=UPI003EB92BBC
MIEEVTVHCPYCGEPFTTLVDWSGGAQHYVEDCQICCQPIEFRLQPDPEGDGDTVSVARGDD